jgi:hypothetical protein
MADERRRLVKSSDELLHDVDVLKDMERQKRREPISSPGFHDLADEIVEKSREVMHSSLEQEELGDEADRGDDTIDDVASSSR